ncbi:MAG TPA: hypothetical protein PL172_07730 [Thermomicrobiales bacterium]|nr:hypothetical protein [Thermomicrobiales bacterium]
MAIRPPRQARPRSRPARRRDLLVTSVASAAIMLFGLRVISALFGVQPWTTAWRVVATPTNLLITPLGRVPHMDTAVISRLTTADIIAFVLVAVVALLAMASVSLRREG